jgi:hypothetical protein
LLINTERLAPNLDSTSPPPPLPTLQPSDKLCQAAPFSNSISMEARVETKIVFVFSRKIVDEKSRMVCVPVVSLAWIVRLKDFSIFLIHGNAI